MYRSDKASVLLKIEGESSASAIACLGQANVSSTMNIDSRNCIGSSVPQKTAMALDWNMAFNGVADISEGGVQEKLFAAYKAGKRIQVVIIYSEVPQVDGYEGTVVISDWSVSLSAPGLAELSFTGQGDGELFIVHDNALGVAVTIVNTNREIANGESISVKKTPNTAVVNYAIEPYSSSEVSGITISADGVITYSGQVKNGTVFQVEATAEVTGDSKTATDVKTFTVVGQAN